MKFSRCLQIPDFFISVFHLGRYQAKTKIKIPQEMPIYMRYLHQHGGMKIFCTVKQYHSLQKEVSIDIAKRR